MKTPWIWRKRSHPKEYIPLLNHDPTNPKIESTYADKPLLFMPQILFTCLLCLVSFIVGYTISGHLDDTRSIFHLPYSEPGEMVIQTSVFNASFSAAPSEESNRAWSDNLPQGEGFMLNQSSLSNVTEFSLYNQLHCIDVLRHRYYTALSQPAVNVHDLHEGKALKNVHHITHCFDFLRQCVECSADTNIEPVDWQLGGVTGWGFERVCRDFDAVRRFSEKWRIPDSI